MSPLSRAGAPATRRDDETVKLFLAGDVMTGRGVDQVLPSPSDPELRESFVQSARTYVELAEAAHGPVPAPVEPAYIWGEALAALERFAPDASIVNLETSITRSSNFWPDKPVHYRMHPGNAGCLEAARIDACTLANNHVLDFGRAGLLETLGVLRARGIAAAGAGRDLDEARRPVRLELGRGAALLVFACGSTSSGIPSDWAAGPSRPGVHFLPDLSPVTAEELAAAARSAKRPGDLAVASIHWGSNWGYEIAPEQVAFAHALVSGGFDIVHGHS
jgi:poly-gamma-glutamate capsule biosynthesis protein CapA/YwtB (metallophosphatase superfamily)